MCVANCVVSVFFSLSWGLKKIIELFIHWKKKNRDLESKTINASSQRKVSNVMKKKWNNVKKKRKQRQTNVGVKEEEMECLFDSQK